MQQRHERQLDARGVHPVRDFGIEVNVEAAIGGNRLQAFGNQQIEVVIVLLERREAARVAIFIKRGAERIVVIRFLAERGYALLAPVAKDGQFGILGSANATQQRPRVRKQEFRQVGLAKNVDNENYDDKREQSARNFQHAARPLPSPALFIVENGLAISHQNNPS